MSLTLKDLYTHHHGMHGSENPVEECIYRASLADLVEVLKQEGAAEGQSYRVDGFAPIVNVPNDGRYLILRLDGDA